jgi:hypothetical protein
MPYAGIGRSGALAGVSSGPGWLVEQGRTGSQRPARDTGIDTRPSWPGLSCLYIKV